MLIPKKVLELEQIASTDAARYALQGIHFFRGGDGKAVAEATDGKTVLRVTWDEMDAGEYQQIEGATGKTVEKFDCILSTEGIDKIKKMIPKKTYIPILKNALLDEVKTSKNGHCYISAGDVGEPVTATMGKVDGNYPDVEQILQRPTARPSGKPDFQVTWVAAVLIRMLEGIQGVTGNKDARVTFDLYESDDKEKDFSSVKPAFVSAEACEDGIKVTGAIMPVRK